MSMIEKSVATREGQGEFGGLFGVGEGMVVEEGGYPALIVMVKRYLVLVNRVGPHAVFVGPLEPGGSVFGVSDCQVVILVQD